MAAPEPGSNRESVGLVGVVVKGLVLLLIVDLVVRAAAPPIGKLSLYNGLLTGRERFPQGIRTDQVYNFAISDLDALFASHVIARPKPSDEYRVLVIGDSAVWGVFLRPEETLSADLSSSELNTCDGRRVVAYNLGFAGLAVAKDLVLLKYAMRYHPDMIIWAISLDAFRPDLQLDRPVLLENPQSVQSLNQEFNLGIDAGLPARSPLWPAGLIEKRRDIADLVRMQFEGVMWSATGIDELYKKKTQRIDAPLSPELAYAGQQPPSLNMHKFLFNALSAGFKIAGTIPVLIVNEPILIGRGAHSDVRYNDAYPRWAYDQYRQFMSETSAAGSWNYADLWDAVPSDDFSDGPFHLQAKGERILAAALSPSLVRLSCRAGAHSP